MVDVEQLVDPELEGLLRELGSRPRSVFLRTSRKDAMRVLRSRTTEGVGPMVVPDALERELVTAHREELAEILKQACRTRLLEGEREKLVNLPYGVRGERFQQATVDELGVRLEHSVRSEPADPWIGATAAVRNAISHRSLAHISVLDLAALGQRVQPSDTWRLMAAISYVSIGSCRAAREFAQAVLEVWPHTEVLFRALEVLALTEAMEGNYVRAVEYQDQACATLGDYPLGQLNRLRYAMLSMQERVVFDASSRLDTMLSVDHPLVQHSCEAVMTRRRCGDWAPTAGAVQLAFKLESRLGDVARRVSRVFH